VASLHGPVGQVAQWRTDHRAEEHQNNCHRRAHRRRHRTAFRPACHTGTGFCGALTTYSTFSYETLRLAEQKAYFYAAMNVTVSVLAGGLSHP
jgi:hypothetical protein